MPRLDIPSEINTVLREYYTCEVTTVNRQGQPITWPSLPYYDEKTGQIVLTVSIAFTVKAYNARHHPQVSLLYSDPNGSGLDRPPAVRVQGDATVAELLNYTTPQILGLFRVTGRRQPDSRRFTSNRFVRSIFTWYLFQRLVITVEPQRIQVWQQGDFNAVPKEIEVKYVE